MPKVKGQATLTDNDTTIEFRGLDADAQVTMNINYIDEDGRPSFSINGYSTTDSHGAFTTTLPVGKLFVESHTGKNIDHVECDGQTDTGQPVNVTSPSDAN